MVEVKWTVDFEPNASGSGGLVVMTGAGSDGRIFCQAKRYANEAERDSAAAEAWAFIDRAHGRCVDAGHQDEAEPVQ